MAAKRSRSRNIVQNFILRQVRGGSPYTSQFPRSRLLTKYLRIPLCNIQKNNVFRSGHVLLGFTKSGEYLMSYCQKLESDNAFGIPSYTYTLHWWRFNLMKPLHEVCHISLFAGEFITDELLLIVCHTLNDRRILIHGYSRPAHGEQSRQCYITFCPSPPCSQCCSLPKGTMTDHGSVCNDSWAVHTKYSLLPPFPTFLPFVQLKMKDTILLNTVDSLVAITVSQQTYHKHPDSALGFSKAPLSGIAKYAVERNSSTNETKVLSMSSSKPERGLLNEDSILSSIVCDNDKEIDGDGNRLLGNCKESEINHSKFSHLSSFCCKTFCNNSTEAERAQISPAVIDGASCIDIQVTNLYNTNYQLIQSDQHNSDVNTESCRVYGLPSIQTQVISLDVERYISEALITSVELKEMYSLLRNYNTQIVDVCDGSQCVILHVISLIYVQPKVGRIIRRRRCSISFLLSWSVSNGDVRTLDVSSVVDQMEKPDKQIFNEGRKRVLDLRKKCFVPSGLTGMQAFSNHTVFTGESLKCIKHPFQPLAVVL